jgi:hypothetical protein
VASSFAESKHKSGAQAASYALGTGVPIRVVKRQEREVYSSPPFSAVVKNEYSYITTPLHLFKTKTGPTFFLLTEHYARLNQIARRQATRLLPLLYSKDEKITFTRNLTEKPWWSRHYSNCLVTATSTSVDVI